MASHTAPAAAATRNEVEGTAAPASGTGASTSASAPSTSTSASSASAAGSASDPARSDSLAVLENAWTRFSTGVAQLAANSNAAQKRLEMEFSALDACVKNHEVQLKEYKKLVAMLDEVEREQGHSSLLSDYRLKLDLLRSSLNALRDTKPKENLGLFMRLLVGRVPMQLWKHGDRLRFKDEYNKFKARTTVIFLLWPLVQLGMLLWGDQVGIDAKVSELVLQGHQLWLLYYYTTLSLRENILLANGSDILHWWIYHHYLSMLLALLMLLWPSPYMLGRLGELLAFGLVQGMVMLFQNNYQRKRLYVRKTLGKARAIDVDSSETLVEKPTDLKALIPMLFSLYLIELWFGCSFIRAYLLPDLSSEPHHFSLLLMGVAFIVLALGNAWTTGLVLVSKSKSRHLKLEVHRRVGSSVNNRKVGGVELQAPGRSTGDIKKE